MIPRCVFVLACACACNFKLVPHSSGGGGGERGGGGGGRAGAEAAPAANDVESIRPTIDEASKLVIANDPVPEATIAAVAHMATAHHDDRFGAYYDTLATRLAYYAAWQGADHQGALAKALHVQGERSGSFADRDDKPLRVAVSSQPGRCYAIAGHWQRPANSTLETDVHMQMAPAAALVGFAIQWTPVRLHQELLYGGCPLNGGGSLRFEVEFRHGDATNTLDWVVVSWPRDQFPDAISSSLILASDPCDTEVWASLWTKPLAGTLAYLESEPVLLVRPGLPNDSWAEVESLSGDVKRIHKVDLSARPTKPVKVRANNQAPECKNAPATNASSSKYSACMAEVDSRYNVGIAVAESRSHNAASAVVRDVAEQQEMSLMSRRDHDRERCKPLYTPIVAAHQRAFETVRTTLEHTEATPTTAGIARVLAEYHAFE